MRTIAQILGPSHTITSDAIPRTKRLTERPGHEIFLVPHHSVSRTLGSILATFESVHRTVSATAAVGPVTAGQDAYVSRHVVPWDTWRPATTASWVDDQAITFEMANLHLEHPWPVGSTGKRWVAELAAAMHVELGMPLNRWHVACHREIHARGWGSYATQCCGDDLANDLDEIVEEAKKIVAGTSLGPGSTEEDDMTIVIRRTEVGNAHYALGPQFARNFASAPAASQFARYATASGSVLGVDEPLFRTLLHGFGIAGVPAPGSNGLWVPPTSATIDPAALEAAIEAALADADLPVPSIDYAAVAKAVNDDAAKRLVA